MGLFSRRKPISEAAPAPTFPNAEMLPEGEEPSALANRLAALAQHAADVERGEAEVNDLLLKGRHKAADHASQGVDWSATAVRANTTAVNEIINTPEFTASQQAFDGVLQPGMDSQELTDERAKSERETS